MRVLFFLGIIGSALIGAGLWLGMTRLTVSPTPVLPPKQPILGVQIEKTIKSLPADRKAQAQALKDKYKPNEMTFEEYAELENFVMEKARLNGGSAELGLCMEKDGKSKLAECMLNYAAI